MPCPYAARQIVPARANRVTLLTPDALWCVRWITNHW